MDWIGRIGAAFIVNARHRHLTQKDLFSRRGSFPEAPI